MHNESLFNINENENDLQPDFFISMFEAEQKYLKLRD